MPACEWIANTSFRGGGSACLGIICLGSDGLVEAADLPFVMTYLSGYRIIMPRRIASWSPSSMNSWVSIVMLSYAYGDLTHEDPGLKLVDHIDFGPLGTPILGQFCVAGHHVCSGTVASRHW